MTDTLKNLYLETNKKYGKNDTIFYSIVYYLSKKVKNLNDFNNNLNKKPDFSTKKFESLISSYYLKQKPLAKITHSTFFNGKEFAVFGKNLSPRNDTEFVTNEALKILEKNPFLKKGADICCGTGVIGLSILLKMGKLNITFNDVSKSAIDNTLFNSKKYGLKIKTIKGDFQKMFFQKYDFIVCNPPYVRIKDLNKNLLKYENKKVFSIKNDPLYVYKKIITNIHKIMNKKFLIIFEIGYDLKKELTNFLKKTNYNFFFLKDFAKLDRVLIIYNNIVC